MLIGHIYRWLLAQRIRVQINMSDFSVCRPWAFTRILSIVFILPIAQVTPTIRGTWMLIQSLMNLTNGNTNTVLTLYGHNRKLLALLLLLFGIEVTCWITAEVYFLSVNDTVDKICRTGNVAGIRLSFLASSSVFLRLSSAFFFPFNSSLAGCQRSCTTWLY
jgi:hypothetical protein